MASPGRRWGAGWSTGRKLAFGLTVLVVAAGFRPVPARAVDGAVWLWTEHREPIQRDPNDSPKWVFRISTDFRLKTDPGGLSQGFLRLGPLFEPVDWFYVAFHLAGSANRDDDDRFQSDLRVEIEPWFDWEATDAVTLQSRNRIETRWVGGDQDVRYRNMVRVQWKPSDEPWILLFWDEVIFRVDAPELTENRVAAMVAYQFDRGRRLEWGYLLRHRLDGEEPRFENIFIVSLLVDSTELVTRERGEVEN